MNKNLKEKFIEYLEYKGYKKSNVQELAGVSKSLFSGDRMNQGLSEMVLMRIVHAFPDLSVNWWLRNEGEMIVARNFTISNDDCPGAKSGQILKNSN